MLPQEAQKTTTCINDEYGALFVKGEFYQVHDDIRSGTRCRTACIRRYGMNCVLENVP